jgi:hypothetical protein
MPRLLTFCGSLVLIVLTLSSCSDPEPEPLAPVLTVTGVGESTSHYRYQSLNTTVKYEGELTMEYGVVFSREPDPLIGGNGVTVEEMGVFEYQSFTYYFTDSSNIGPSTIYHAKSFIRIEDRLYYSDELSFKSFAGSWKKLAPFPGLHRKKSLSFFIDNKVFVVGGTSMQLNTFKDVWSYSVATDQWVKKSDLPLSSVSSDEAVTFVVQSNAYIMSKAGLWKYNVAGDSWERVNDGLNQTRMLAFTIGDKAYAGHGHFAGNLAIYDPALNTWTGIPRTEAAIYPGEADWLRNSVSTGTRAYVGFGINTDFDEKGIAEMYEFAPSGNTWQKRNIFSGNGVRKGLVSFAINSKAYFGLGLNTADVTYGDLLEYNPATDGWTTMVSIPAPSRTEAFYCSSSSKAYIGMGLEYFSGGQVTELFDFWEFTP